MLLFSGRALSSLRDERFFFFQREEKEKNTLN